MEPKPGDLISISTTEGVHEGILMPSLDLTGKDTLILKLKNGYNIGIDKKHIKKISILEKYSPKKTQSEKVNFERGLPVVSVLSTGGTISSKIDYRTGGVYADYTAKDFARMIPELRSISNLNTEKIMSLMSEDILPRDWITMAKKIRAEIKKGVDGIVLTHGTDTLHFTASALSFMLKDINVPVVITGSQRSIDRGSSDAFMNLLCSVKAAAEFDGSEVVVCMHESSDDDSCILIRGTKVRKMHTSRRDAFRPINDIPLARVHPHKDIEILSKDYRKADRSSKDKVNIKASFEEDIALVYVYPGIDPEILDFYLKKGIKGLVIAATALGHVNTWTEKSMMPYLEKYYSKKIPVFITTQTLYGRVDPYVYSNLRKISLLGHGIYLQDMLPETAYIKLGWVLSQKQDYEDVKKMMLENIRGEFNPRMTKAMFLN